MSASLEERNEEETLRTFEKTYEFTEKDMNYKFTDNQLKEICMKHKCCVVASRWNIVYEYRLWLMKEGRFTNRTPEYERLLLTKAVNRHKQKLMYDENEIKKTLEKEWRDRKKDNILSVNLWRQRAEEEKQMRTDDEVQRQSQEEESDSEGDIEEEERSQRLSQDRIHEEDESDTKGEMDNEEPRQQTEEERDDFTVAPNSQSLLANTETLTQEISIHVQEDPVLSEQLGNQFDVNTQSMSLTADSYATLTVFSQLQSENITSEDFNNEIPLTSTQKENNSQE